MLTTPTADELHPLLPRVTNTVAARVVVVHGARVTSIALAALLAAMRPALAQVETAPFPSVLVVVICGLALAAGILLWRRRRRRTRPRGYVELAGRAIMPGIAADIGVEPPPRIPPLRRSTREARAGDGGGSWGFAAGTDGSSCSSDSGGGGGDGGGGGGGGD